MKNKYILIIAVLVLMSFNLKANAADDKYSQLALEISNAAGDSLVDKKIAIIPFSYADGREGTTDGSIVSERLTMKMINLQKYEIIERSVLDKVMNELKLQSSGIMDANSTKELGKVLGVDAIITGTLIERKGGKIEVNARLIKTETARAIGAAQVIIEKDWMGGDQAVAQPVQQAVYQPKAKTAARARVKGQNEYGYFDIIAGFGSNSVDITYADSTYGILFSRIGFNSGAISDGPYDEIIINEMEASGAGPIGFRIGGFGKNAIGGALEMSINRTVVGPQDGLTGTRDGVSTTFDLPSSGDYLTMTSFGMIANLYIRHAGEKVDPYFGMGLGLSLNKIEMPYTMTYKGNNVWARPVDEMGIGLMLNIPVGIRFRTESNNQFFGELRYEMNSVGFSRNRKYEKSRIVTQGIRFVFGMGFGF
jgi:TolB-like protein